MATNSKDRTVQIGIIILLILAVAAGILVWLKWPRAQVLPEAAVTTTPETARTTATPKVTTRPAAKAPSLGQVRYLNDLNNGNWFVTARTATMHVNSPGTYMYCSFSRNLMTPEQQDL